VTRLLPVAVVLLLAAPAWAGAPKQRHTAADMAIARSALLDGRDLGAMWKPDSPKPTTDPLTCSPRLTPQESDLVETGSAIGPLFIHGSDQAIAQSVHVYATVSDADAAWARRTMKKVVLCMQRRLEDRSTMMSWISVVSQGTLDVPQLVPHAAAYRVTADASAGKKKAKVYLDVLLLGRDRTLTTVVLTSYWAPLSSAFEEKVVREISERMPAK
jgi:hypothetical protein